MKKEEVKKRGKFKLNDRGGSSLFVILIMAILVLGAVFWVASGSFTNFTKSNFSKPESYLRYVEKKDLLGRNFDSLSKAYQNASGQVDYTRNALEEEFSFTVGERGEKYIKMAAQFGIDLSWLQNFGVSVLINSKDDDLQIKSSLSVNDQKAISPEIIMDMHNKKAYLGAEELTKEYLEFDLSERLKDEDFKDAKARFEKWKSVVSDSKKLNKLMEKYLDLALGDLESVEKKKNVELTSASITQKCTELTVTLEESELKKIIKTVCQELSQDQDIKQMMKDYLSAKKSDEIADQKYEQFQKNMDGIAGKIDDIDFNLERVIIRLYLDKQSNVIGRIYEIQKGEESPIIVKMIMPVEKNKAGLEISYQDGSKNISLNGLGKLQGSKLSGEYTLFVNDAKMMNLEVGEFDLKALRDGLVKFHLVIKPGTDLDMKNLYSALGIQKKTAVSALALLRPGLDLKADIGKNKSSAEIRITDNDEDLVSIAYKGSTKKTAAIKMPSKTVDIKDEEAVNKYVESLDWEKLDKILDKANVPMEYLQALKRYLEKSGAAGK